MRLSIAAAVALALGYDIAASPIRSRTPYAVKETHFAPRGWRDIGPPPADHTLNLRINLKNKNFAELERHLYAVSDPANVRYGKHFSKQEVDELTRPDAHASSLVDEWLNDCGIASHERKINSAGDSISFLLPVSVAETLLDTTYSMYTHDDGSTVVRTTSWSLPEHLHDHISTIQPTTAFLRPSPKLRHSLLSNGGDFDQNSFPPNSSQLAGNCNFEGITSKCLQILYGTDTYTPRSDQSHIGLTNYLGEIPSRSDAALFLERFQPSAVVSAARFEQISIDGGPIDNGTSVGTLEGNLDIQTIAGLVSPINITSYSTGGSPPLAPGSGLISNTNEPYLTWLDYILSSPSIPQTISTSYGDNEQTVPPSYAETVCQGFAKLGLQGVSVLFSSGDNGVGANGTCTSSDSTNRTAFIPEFPASCPYVTVVGGTRNYPEVVAFDPRNGYVAGSGFSNYFAQPYYQTNAVSAYLETVDSSTQQLYNASGRAYPDISASSYRFISVRNNSVLTLDGTSAAAPTAASIIALLNDALLAAGKPALGFLNPWLYSGAGANGFTDIVSGSSSGCDTAGFKAGEGWDAASGWGTPKFPVLLELLGVGSNTTSNCSDSTVPQSKSSVVRRKS